MRKKRVLIIITIIVLLFLIIMVSLVYVKISKDKIDESFSEWSIFDERMYGERKFGKPFYKDNENFDDVRIDNSDTEVNLGYDNLGERLVNFLVDKYGEDFTCELVSAGDLAVIYTINGEDELYYYAGNNVVVLNGEEFNLE